METTKAPEAPEATEEATEAPVAPDNEATNNVAPDNEANVEESGQKNEDLKQKVRSLQKKFTDLTSQANIKLTEKINTDLNKTDISVEDLNKMISELEAAIEQLQEANKTSGGSRRRKFKKSKRRKTKKDKKRKTRRKGKTSRKT